MAESGSDDFGPSCEEHGRRYGIDRGGEYLLPIDGVERERLDVMHTMLKTVRDSNAKLLHAPNTSLEPGSSASPPARHPRVMDLACGTGIWLLEMAETYPHAECHGFDINRMAPLHLLPNIEIHCPVDIEQPWAEMAGEWDIIHLQLGLGAVKDWGAIYSRVRKHLKPGTGWFEGVEIDWQPRSNDGTLSAGSKLNRWWNEIAMRYQWLGYPINYSNTTAQALEKAKFREIQSREYMIPLSGWNTRSNRLHRSGIWCNIAMSAGADRNYGLEAMSLRPLTRVGPWPVDHIRRFCTEVMEEASDSNIHAYFKLHVWWARAPHPSEMSAEQWRELEEEAD
ncbi:hypothetical protein DV737_g4630, partial [Chaetothyriales sp. CBS 132003]